MKPSPQNVIGLGQGPQLASNRHVFQPDSPTDIVSSSLPVELASYHGDRWYGWHQFVIVTIYINLLLLFTVYSVDTMKRTNTNTDPKDTRYNWSSSYVHCERIGSTHRIHGLFSQLAKFVSSRMNDCLEFREWKIGGSVPLGRGEVLTPLPLVCYCAKFSR